MSQFGRNFCPYYLNFYFQDVEFKSGYFKFPETVLDSPCEKENIPHSETSSFPEIIDLTDSPAKLKKTDIIDLISDDSQSPIKV